MSELTDDIEVVSPGQLLKEGREKLGWSQQEVAQRLNLRSSIIHSLERDRFDDKISATFVRGYLRAYAKILGISEDLIISSYEHLGIAQVQYAEMQSFSRRTSQEAHDNRLMMVTYAIALVLVALTVLWWLQQESSTGTDFSEQPEQIAVTSELAGQASELAGQASEVDVIPTTDPLANSDQAKTQAKVTKEESKEPVQVQAAATPEQQSVQVTESPEEEEPENAITAEDEKLAEVVMVFEGDCWVKVEDGTGERVAIGTKRVGKRMVLKGLPPFKVILGAPEAVTIQYQGQPFDISHMKPGKTARFSIPFQE